MRGGVSSEVRSEVRGEVKGEMRGGMRRGNQNEEKRQDLSFLFLIICLCQYGFHWMNSVAISMENISINATPYSFSLLPLCTQAINVFTFRAFLQGVNIQCCICSQLGSSECLSVSHTK